MLGLDSRNDLLTFGEVNALVKSDDIDLFAIADQMIAGQLDHIDQSFRMQHTGGHWIWLRVRCELSHTSADGGLHLIGIAVDITEQKSLAEKSVEADLRLRDAIETIPEAFVLWDAEDRLVLCNSHFQRLHKLPDTAVTPGTSYETVIEVGSMPEVRTRLQENRRAGAGRPHLRGAARRRQLAAYFRAPHQGRRLRLGRHRHHPHQGTRAEADRKRHAPARQRDRPEALANRACRPRRKIFA
jgi:PAS domain-containing protein